MPGVTIVTCDFRAFDYLARMSLDSNLHRRRSVRLRARDYSSPGHYYLTLCTQDRRPLFGNVVNGVMHLNELGIATDRFWKEIPQHFPQVELDEYVIMPNHVHGIIQIVDHVKPDFLPAVRAVGVPIVPGLVVVGPHGVHVGANDRAFRPDGNLPLQPACSSVRTLPWSKFFPLGHGTSRTIGSMIRGFKIGVTRYAGNHGIVGEVWQRGFHDHIIRNQRSLDRIRAYIRDNPANWPRDRNNPDHHPSP